MRRSKRRNVQTAHISLQIFINVKEQEDKKFSAPELASEPNALSSEYFGPFAFAPIRPSPSLLRFGEAVFTKTRRKPQEEKTER